MPQFVVLGLLACLSPIALVITLSSWRSPAAYVPAHWDFSGNPTSMPSTALFWAALMPSLICALVAVAAAVFLGPDVGRWSTASGLGILLAFGAAIAVQWPIAQLTAGRPDLHDGIGAPFLLYLAAAAWGVIGFAIASTRQPPQLTGE